MLVPGAPEVDRDCSNRAQKEQLVREHLAAQDMFKILFSEEESVMQFSILIKLSVLFQNKCIGSAFSCSVLLCKKWKDSYLGLLDVSFFVSHLFGKLLMRVTLGIGSSLSYFFLFLC